MSKKTTKSNSRRKAFAVVVASLGVAGLAMASAATLTLDGGANNLVQAGTDDLTATLCQASVIDVAFTLDGAVSGALQTGTEFGYPAAADAVVLDEIDADCAGKNIHVSLGDAGNEAVGAEWTGTAVAGPLVLALNGSTPAFGASLTNGDIEDITQVSVTIFD